MPCEKCGHKLLLGRIIITDIVPDQEPYESDEEIEKDEIDCDIFLDVHYCENCEIIHDIWDDEEEHLQYQPRSAQLGVLENALYHLGSMVRDYVNGEVSRDKLENEAEKARQLSGCDDEE